MRAFKSCTCCHTEWDSREDFLTDPQIDLVGYQVNFGKPRLGYFLFNHLICKSTLALKAGLFVELYDGPVFGERRTGSDTCRGFCLHPSELSPCTEKCECAYVREVVQILRRWPKTAPVDSGVLQP